MGWRTILVASMIACFLALAPSVVLAGPEVPKIDCLVMSATQPADTSGDVIWYDNFDVDRIASYFEPAAGSGDLRYSTTALGRGGKSMECFYPTGGFGYGNRKIAFGDCPVTNNRRKSGQKFDDIYWRIYVKFPKDWVGDAAAKMSRATVFSGPNWSQASILHCWSAGRSTKTALTLDPATGVRNNVLATTAYNNFRNLRWLGNYPPAKFGIADPNEVGRWVCVECRMKLNSITPTTDAAGKTIWDGYGAMWIDGKLETERKNMNFRGTLDTYGINAVLLEAYWNNKSPVNQYRWYDDFVVSTKPIGPVTVPANPTMFKTPLASSACTGWEVVIAGDPEGKNIVWSSARLPGDSDKLAVGPSTGTFSGSAAGLSALPTGPMYFCKVRQQDSTGWSDWSYWHQPFMVESAGGTTKPSAQTTSAPAN
jgi:hypothetical protein